jgi:hypothetical protein
MQSSNKSGRQLKKLGRQFNCRPNEAFLLFQHFTGGGASKFPVPWRPA